MLALLLACSHVVHTNDPGIDVDVNGDGLADLVGADGDGETNRLVVYYGSPDFFEADGTANSSFTLPFIRPDVEEEEVMTHPRAVGDLDGDGTTDIASGMFDGPDRGALVRFGSSGGLQPSVQVQVPGFVSGEGFDVLWVGDLTCDGRAELLVYSYQLVGQEPEDAWLYRSDEGGIDGTPRRLAGVLKPVGDVDGDGCDDVLVDGELFLGDAGDLVASGWTSSDPERFPMAPVRPVDVDADGLMDFMGLFDGLGNAWHLGDEGGIPTSSRGLDNIWSAGEASFPIADLDGDGWVDYVRWGTVNSEIPGAAIGDWKLDWALGRPPKELSEERLRAEVHPTLYPYEAWQLRAPDVYQRYLGTVGDLDGDGFADLVTDGRLTDVGAVHRGGRRFRAEATVLFDTASAGWAGWTTMAADVRLLLVAGALAGCSDVCGSFVAQDPTELRGIERCRVVDGELLVMAGYRDELVLPGLEEVTGRMIVEDVAVLDLPALERVGSGPSRGDLVVGGLSGRFAAPVLRTVGRGWYEEPDDGFLSESRMEIRADGPTSVDLGSLEIPGGLLLDGLTAPLDLPSLVSVGALGVSGRAPAAFSTPVLPVSLQVSDTTGLERLDVPQPGALARLSILGNADLRDVSLGLTAADVVEVVENPALASFVSELPCVDLDWRDNAMEAPDGAPGCR